MTEINSVTELVALAADLKLGGYEADLVVRAASEQGTIVVDFSTNRDDYPPFEHPNGQYWFFADGALEQVL